MFTPLLILFVLAVIGIPIMKCVIKKKDYIVPEDEKYHDDYNFDECKKFKGDDLATMKNTTPQKRCAQLLNSGDCFELFKKWWKR